MNVCMNAKNDVMNSANVCQKHTQTLHPERLWSLFTFYLGGISALHPIRNDFGAKLRIPLGMTLELIHL
jgi:hypothetical protein